MLYQSVCMTRNYKCVYIFFLLIISRAIMVYVFSKSMSQLCLFMRHTIIQNGIHVEITYVFDTCNI